MISTLLVPPNLPVLDRLTPLRAWEQIKALIPLFSISFFVSSSRRISSPPENPACVDTHTSYRVAGGCCQPQAPLEPCMRLSPHTARASLKATPVGLPGCVTSCLHRSLRGVHEFAYLRATCSPYNDFVARSKQRLRAYKGSQQLVSSRVFECQWNLS
jgi:hypothetical protein